MVEAEKVFGNTRSISDYAKVENVGEGTYGTVCKASNIILKVKAEDKNSNNIAALKKLHIFSEDVGFPITAIREIQLLRELAHPNVIKLKEVVVGFKQ